MQDGNPERRNAASKPTTMQCDMLLAKLAFSVVNTDAITKGFKWIASNLVQIVCTTAERHSDGSTTSLPPGVLPVFLFPSCVTLQHTDADSRAVSRLLHLNHQSGRWMSLCPAPFRTTMARTCMRENNWSLTSKSTGRCVILYCVHACRGRQYSCAGF